ncbi:hypothetical protein OK074_3138 [Actinobacteria bacterium OK074]|nr:hypothetical protein OK074_3138 [Actinobacteria bacterium OK074]
MTHPLTHSLTRPRKTLAACGLRLAATALACGGVLLGLGGTTASAAVSDTAAPAVSTSTLADCPSGFLCMVDSGGQHDIYACPTLRTYSFLGYVTVINNTQYTVGFYGSLSAPPIVTVPPGTAGTYDLTGALYVRC